MKKKIRWITRTGVLLALLVTLQYLTKPFGQLVTGSFVNAVLAVSALFGGLGVAFISKNWKIAIAPILLMLVLFIFVPALNEGTVGIMVPVGVLFTVGVARILYKKGKL